MRAHVRKYAYIRDVPCRACRAVLTRPQYVALRAVFGCRVLRVMHRVSGRVRHLRVSARVVSARVACCACRVLARVGGTACRVVSCRAVSCRMHVAACMSTLVEEVKSPS